MDEAGLLRLAFSLAVLTFYTGVLIYSLPIPYRGLKSWAPRLIADSILAASLIAIYYALANLPGFIAGLLGASWEMYEARVFFSIGLSAALKLLVYLAKLAAELTQGLIGYTIASYSWVLERLSDLALVTAITLKVLEWVAVNVYKYFIALGLVLYSVPFRLGRAAGAWLIALGIILPAGLPALPLFEARLIGSGDGGVGGVVASYVVVADRRGDPLDYGVLYFMSGSDMDGETYSAYPLVNGQPVGAFGSRVATYPAGVDVYAYVEVSAVAFALTPRPLDYSAFRVVNGTPVMWLEAPVIIYNKGFILAYMEGEPEGFNYTETEGHATFWIVELQGAPSEVRWPEDCDVEVDVEVYSGGITYSEVEWSWLGVEGEGVRLSPSGPVHYRLDIYYGECDTEPDFGVVEKRDYFIDTLAGSLDVVSVIYYFLLAQLFLPTMYIAILALLVYGLARLLGGRDRGLPRVF